jgi:DNA helicase IV
LQPAKTTIIRKSEYVQRFVVTPERVEIESLTSKLHELLEQAGWPDDYEQEIEYDDLPQHFQEEVDALNLVEVFREQLALERSDPVIMTFLLHRLGQLNFDEITSDILSNIEKLQHVIDAVVRYLENLRGLTSEQKAKIGKKVLASAAKRTRSTYERVCLLSLFTKGLEFDNEGRFERLHEAVSDPHSKREITLALGRAGKDHWFMQRRRDCGTLEPWLRRAFIAASSCLDEDARGPFYRSLRGGSDVLEKAIIKWASANPFA